MRPSGPRYRVTSFKQNYKEGDVVKKGQVLFRDRPPPLPGGLGPSQSRPFSETRPAGHRPRPIWRVSGLWPPRTRSARKTWTMPSPLNSPLRRVHGGGQRPRSTRPSLNLEFTKITSPIDGIAGIAKAQIGNLVGPGATEELTTVSTVDPIKVYLGQRAGVPESRREGKVLRREKVPLELILADGSV